MIARARERRGRDDRGAPGETLPPARSIASQEWSIRYRVLVHGARYVRQELSRLRADQRAQHKGAQESCVCMFGIRISERRPGTVVASKGCSPTSRSWSR
jgi:hypothetical protein